MWDSNLRPHEYQCDALATELSGDLGPVAPTGRKIYVGRKRVVNGKCWKSQLHQQVAKVTWS